jgi:NitT/TauT family transport system substrate-binding protein
VTLSRSIFLGGTAALALTPGVARGADGIPVKIAATASESASNVLYAADLGFFKENGIDAELQLLANSGVYANGIVSGTFDIGAVSAGSVVVAHERNIPFQVIANGGVYSSTSPQTFLCVGRNSSIRTASDFKGKTIAVSTLRDIVQVAVMGWLDRNGGDYRSVNFVEIPPAAMSAAIQQGRIDGAFIGEPILSLAGDEVRPLAPAYSSVGNRFAIYEWVTNRAWGAANAGTVKRLRAAFDQAATWALANRPQAAQILAKYAKMSPELAQKMHHVEWETGASPKLLQPVIDAMAKYGLLTKAYPASELF